MSDLGRGGVLSFEEEGAYIVATSKANLLKDRLDGLDGLAVVDGVDEHDAVRFLEVVLHVLNRQPSITVDRSV